MELIYQINPHLSDRIRQNFGSKELLNKTTNLRKIQNVIKYNYLMLYFVEIPIQKGLWYYPSLFNHSCISNCYHFGFRDILIIIAINDIEPNSELYLNYFTNDKLYDERQKYSKELYNFECNCILCKYENNKQKESNEKKIFNEYIKKLNKNNFLLLINEEKKVKPENILNQKDIEKMLKFIETNKKLFSCYEKSLFYMQCANCMRRYDPYFSYEYLEKSIKYCENRDYYFEKMTLAIMYTIDEQLRSDVRLQFAGNKFREFCEKYFSNQEKFVNLLIEKLFKKIKIIN